MFTPHFNALAASLLGVQSRFMTNLSLAMRELEHERDRLVAQLVQVNRAISVLQKRGSRAMSAESRQRIAAAQKARWAKWRKSKAAA